MFGIDKIIGLPLKINRNHSIYIPFEYLRYYDISEKCDKFALETSAHSLFYRPLRAQPMPGIKIKPIRAGLTQLPAAWMHQNNLSVGDYVHLLGKADGLLVYVSHKNGIFTDEERTPCLC